MLQNRDKSERENFYHNLAQFMLPILAKKKSGSASTFFFAGTKKNGRTGISPVPGILFNTRNSLFDIGERSEPPFHCAASAPLFFSAKLKVSSLKKAFILEYDA